MTIRAWLREESGDLNPCELAAAPFRPLAFAWGFVVALLVLWIRSYWISDNYVGGTATDWWRLGTQSGSFCYSRVTGAPFLDRGQLRFGFASIRSNDRAIDDFLTPDVGIAGFRYTHYRRPSPGEIGFGLFQIPFFWLIWIIVVIPGMPILLVQWRRSRRRLALSAAKLCPSCGYDLRATPHRCPECGAPKA